MHTSQIPVLGRLAVAMNSAGELKDEQEHERSVHAVHLVCIFHKHMYWADGFKPFYGLREKVSDASPRLLRPGNSDRWYQGGNCLNMLRRTPLTHLLC